jgi:hypothetical protein
MSNELLAVVDAFEQDLSALRGFAFAMSCAINQGEDTLTGDDFYAMFGMIIDKLTEEKERFRLLAVG